jgi:hypothetical protein
MRPEGRGVTGKALTILREGRPDTEYRDLTGGSRFANQLPRITCADSFSLSVQAGQYLYSTPREDAGPWTHVEVGFPSARPEPWAEWESYCESPNDPTGTVYGYVPLPLVEALIALHGGEAE